MKQWREELLRVLMESGEEYVRGEDLAERFGYSRAAVWKNISVLRREGHPIEATTNRGYRIAPDYREFKKKISEALQKEKIDAFFAVTVVDATPSTNLLAREAGVRGDKEIGVFVAGKQTAGRGRRGRTWISSTDEGLWFSLLIRPAADPRDASALTLLFGLCVLKAIQRICNVPVGIKWPNDIVSLQNGKKLCGILSETSMEDNQISYAVVGCGINVSQKEFPEEIQSLATSLLLECEGTMESSQAAKVSLLAAILSEVALRYPAFITDPSGFIAEYRANCATIGRPVRIESAIPQEGIARDISDNGDLLVSRADGTILVCTSGEVSVRGMLGYF